MLQDQNALNIGGYDSNAFKDNTAVGIVSLKLSQSNCIMPHIDSSNTVPNIDGRIEVCEEYVHRKIPVATFAVQVKALPEDYLNHNKFLHKDDKHKYCCDTKAFSFALLQSTLDPVLLLMVDIKTNDIFWKYLSYKYCMELETFKTYNKTIYFNDKDKISDFQEWSIELKKIFDDKRSKIILTDDPIPEEFQKACERLNSLFDNEFAFIKQIFFPDTWKLGISYFIDSESKFKSLGIYRLANGQNDLLVKNFNDARKSNIVEISYYGQSASDIVNSEIIKLIDLLFKEENYFLCIMPDLAIQDIIFNILDSHFAKKIMQNITSNDSEVILGYPDEVISLNELQKLLSKEQWEQEDFNLLSGCIGELNQRGLKYCRRFWRKSMKRNVLKTSNGGVTFNANDDILDIAKDNVDRFLRNFLQFHNETIKIFGNRTKDLFDTGEYILYIENNLQGCHYIKNSCDTLKFSWSFESKTFQEVSNICDQSSSVTSCGGISIHPQAYLTYSWYDVWQMWCYFTFSKFLSPDANIPNSFIDTLHYFRNYCGYSHNYIVTNKKSYKKF
jgi:hypothetical protein